MTHTISAFSSCHPGALLGYSAAWPEATIEVNVVKCCWEIMVRCCRLHTMQLRLVVPWQMDALRYRSPRLRACNQVALAASCRGPHAFSAVSERADSILNPLECMRTAYSRQLCQTCARQLWLPASFRTLRSTPVERAQPPVERTQPPFERAQRGSLSVVERPR